jgi:dipeptide/tripeptide permease
MTVATPISDGVAPGGKQPGLGKVIRDQKKSILVALGLAVATFWIAGQLGEWRLAGCIAGGIGLGLANHLATERWLLKTISSGEEITRNKLAAATFVRLLILTVVAVGIAVVFWPDGIGLLLGLAIFRLIALVMTITPLLRELKKDANTP